MIRCLTYIVDFNVTFDSMHIGFKPHSYVIFVAISRSSNICLVYNDMGDYLDRIGLAHSLPTPNRFSFAFYFGISMLATEASRRKPGRESAVS